MGGNNTWQLGDFPPWTDDDVQECADWWKDQLGLCSWKIDASIKPYSVVEGWARCRRDAKYEHATIELCPWGERDTDKSYCLDMEVDVVHELVHLRLHALEGVVETSGELHNQHELAVERLAQALVNVRRGNV